jgi:hypothetical protein
MGIRNMRIFNRRHNQKLEELRKLLVNVGIKNIKNTNKYSNLRQKASKFISRQYYNTNITLSNFNLHKTLMNKIRIAQKSKLNEQRANNLRALKLYKTSKPAFISGGRNNGYAQPMSANERNREEQNILKQWELKKREILARYPNNENFEQYRT